MASTIQHSVVHSKLCRACWVYLPGSLSTSQISPNEYIHHAVLYHLDKHDCFLSIRNRGYKHSLWVSVKCRTSSCSHVHLLRNLAGEASLECPVDSSVCHSCSLLGHYRGRWSPDALFIQPSSIELRNDWPDLESKDRGRVDSTSYFLSCRDNNQFVHVLSVLPKRHVSESRPRVPHHSSHRHVLSPLFSHVYSLSYPDSKNAANIEEMKIHKT